MSEHDFISFQIAPEWRQGISTLAPTPGANTARQVSGALWFLDSVEELLR